jgi:hypothetical protein
MRRRKHAQDSFQTFLVHRHLNRDMRQVIIHHLIRPGPRGGVILRILVVVRYRADHHRYVLNDLEREELYIHTKGKKTKKPN